MWLLFAFCGLGVVIWYYLRLRTMSVLKRNGIPGPQPNLFFGNLFQLKGLSMIEKQTKLIEDYGNIVGYYTGARPNLLVADPELAKLILIKDFDNFVNRTDFLRYQHPSHKSDGALIIVRGQKWKHTRSLLSPAFTGAKLKKMIPLLDDSISSFLEKVDNSSKTDQPLNIYELYQRLTAEMIIKTAFGFNIDAQNDLNNQFLKAAHQYLQSKVNKILFILVNVFPRLNIIIHPIRRLYESICTDLGLTPIGKLWTMSGAILKKRKNNTKLQRDDLVQGMLNSRISKEEMAKIKYEDINGTFPESKLLSDKQNKPKPMKSSDKNDFYLTDNQIRANCIVFYGAGFETSSTGLAFCTHFLINYPEVQERVREEVVNLYESEGKLDYNTVTKLDYMEQVLNESMRIYPPVITGSTRECLADYHYKNMIIPKGTMVAIATYHLNHDKQFWTDPEKFDPDRFHPDNKSERTSDYWQVFGSGPRNCIGMRLAYLQMKLTLAKLLLNYRLECVPQTELGQLQTKINLVSMSPKNDVYVRAIKL